MLPPRPSAPQPRVPGAGCRDTSLPSRPQSGAGASATRTPLQPHLGGPTWAPSPTGNRRSGESSGLGKRLAWRRSAPPRAQPRFREARSRLEEAAALVSLHLYESLSHEWCSHPLTAGFTFTCRSCRDAPLAARERRGVAWRGVARRPDTPVCGAAQRQARVGTCRHGARRGGRGERVRAHSARPVRGPAGGLS